MRRILVVDDNLDAADSLKMMLHLYRFDVRTAYSGKAALNIVQEFNPHVAIIDLSMPVMNGYEVARSIREMKLQRQPMLLALTGLGMPQDHARSQEAGYDQPPH
jgi:CheY-like chemotaxis protein